MVIEMKKIGEGWQYTVYDLGNGRVLKKFHSPLKSYWVILKDIFPFQNDSLFEISGFSRGMKVKALESFEILKKKELPSGWLGNPKFINDLDFEQDKAKPLHDAFSQFGVEEAKKIIDKFMEFNKKLLERGVIDKSFNITKNYGLNNEGEIVLIDIGELFDDPKRIKEQCANRAWAKDYVAGHIASDEVREYFIEEMDRNFKNYGTNT